eukprot:TRINITY_DN66096_c0_g1_i1.p1 TRINITY_DN66096_c0_g1~~TRINITY_DN66096_c0_g1_i1.p1  ORF type:complete len:635 (+),score=168.57 TRINITY_DN66096_c0_g1_i1:91-1905(+)
MPWRCLWLDTVCGVCGWDPDEMLALEMPLTVSVHDRALGTTSYVLLLVILTYIVADLVVRQGYLVIDHPVGTVSMSVSLPPLSASSPDLLPPGCTNPAAPPDGPLRCCRDCPAAWEKDVHTVMAGGGMPYCAARPSSDPDCPLCPTANASVVRDGLRLPCLGMDNMQFPVASFGADLLVSSRVGRYEARLACEHGRENDSFRAPDMSCIREQPGQYPPADSLFRGFIAGVEDATVKVDHTVTSPVRHLDKRGWEMRGRLEGCGGARRPLPVWDQAADSAAIDRNRNRLWSVRELLGASAMVGSPRRRCGVALDEPSLIAVPPQLLARCQEFAESVAAGRASHLADLECGPSVRHDGIVLLLTLDYDNTYDVPSSLDDPEYSVTVHALPRSGASIERVDFQRTQVGSNGTIQFEVRRGLHIIAVQTGRIGSPSFKAALINLTAALGLLAVSHTLTWLALQWVCPLYTGDTRYADTVVQPSPDFNTDAQQRAAVVARRTPPDGTFFAGEHGEAYWRGDLRTVEISWAGGGVTQTRWPNEGWFRGEVPLPVTEGSMAMLRMAAAASHDASPARPGPGVDIRDPLLSSPAASTPVASSPLELEMRFIA